MRRNLKQEECIALLEKNYVGHLAYISQGQPYCVPITYFYDHETNTITSYSSEGHKLASMRKNRAISLAVDEITSVANWKSVLAIGTFEELTQIDAKHMLHKFSEGVKEIMSEHTGGNPKYISDFSAKLDTEEATVVFRIIIQEIIGKIRVS